MVINEIPSVKMDVFLKLSPGFYKLPIAIPQTNFKTIFYLVWT